MSPIDEATITRRGLTASYAVALLIVASMLLLAFLTLSYQLGKNQDDARLINVSGRQRMLSQRIALLASKLLDPKIDQNRDAIRDDLQGSVELMGKSQDWLIGVADGKANSKGQMSAQLQKLYFGDDGVAPLVEAYLADATRLDMLAHSTESFAEAGLLADAISQRTISGGLLGKLDRVVQQYEIEAESKLRRFWWFEFAFLLVGLGTLAGEAVFIFRPMVGAVIRSVTALRSANEELVEFAYRISHDLRAPILSSIGIAELATDALNENDVDEAKRSLTHIHDALNRVSVTSDDIVQLAKLRMMDVDKESFRLKEVIDESLAALRRMPGYGDITISIEAADCEPIWAKRLFVKQSIEALVSNAIKYRDPVVDRPFVEIAATVENGICVISVTDNGLGIAAECRPKIFLMFQRFHPKVSFGSGLGLYLVKQNATALQGDVSYHPCDNGSRFVISFPVREGVMEK